ncbi:hypothetical protein BG005_010848 [Podila minutissima]|nr:hypothetical protein BG005_010848 [Podila minutissima]
MSYAEYRYNTQYDDDEDSPTTVGNSTLNDDVEFTIRIDKGQSDPDLSTDKNSDYDDTYTHTNNNIQPQQQAHNPYQKQPQYPSNHYGYDIQKKEKETQRTAEEWHVNHSDARENCSPIENISEAILAPLPCLPPPPPAATEENFHQEGQLHHRSTIATDSAVSLTGDDILTSPCSINRHPRSNTKSSTFSSSSISPYPRQTKNRSGSLSAGPRSTSLGETAIEGYDIPVPPLALQHLQHQQHTTPSGRGIIVNFNTQPPSADVNTSNPPSPGKTGWERETPTTPTPQLHKGHTSYQHSSSLFDFFRTRKQPISKNSAHHAAAAAAANTSGATFPTPPLPSNLPLMGTPPTIARSRMGPLHRYPSYAPVPPLLQKQSLDLCAFSGYQTSSSSTFGSPMTKHDCHAATVSILPTSVMTPSSSTSSFASPHFHSPHTFSSCANPSHHPTLINTAHSTLSKVAAVVGATIGKRRGSVTAEALEQGQGPSHAKAHESSNSSQIRQGLSQSQLNEHAKFLKEAKTTQDLVDYIDKLYHTVLNESVALDHANKQVSALQKELHQTKSHAEENRKGLVDEAGRVKKQIVTMEENFLLWRNKVHNDQMAQQEDFLHERLVRQNRIEELEDDLNTSQDEVARLRRRLLVLEYEDGYVGPTSLLNDGLSAPIAPENSPMTVATHKRRSADFKILEMRAQDYEHQLQGLVRALETERQDHQKDFVEFRMRMHIKVAKLEEEIQAAKMESSIYTEMMHEIVTENDTLRTKVKQAQRKSRIGGGGSSTSFGSSPKSYQDYYSYPGFDGSGDSMCGSDDEMEDIAIL